MADETIDIEISTKDSGLGSTTASVRRLDQQLDQLDRTLTSVTSTAAVANKAMQGIRMSPRMARELSQASQAMRELGLATRSLRSMGDVDADNLVKNGKAAVQTISSLRAEMQRIVPLSNTQAAALRDTAQVLREFAAASALAAKAETARTAAQASANRAQAAVLRATTASADLEKTSATRIAIEQERTRRAELAASAQAAHDAARSQERLERATYTATYTAARHGAALTQQQAALSALSDSSSRMARMQAMGAAGLSIPTIASTLVGAQQERAFADVARTSEATGVQLAKLRDELYATSTEFGKAFQDVTGIATLGAQLGIATDQLSSFTEATSQFSTLTGVQVETAATAFGRIRQMLGGLKESSQGAGDGYKVLADQVTYLGAKSVATEQEILVMVQSLAATGKQAGLTQDQVVGLSGTLASLGVPKEWARGSIQRVFGLITAAAAKGGEEMEVFAKRLGFTGEEFNKLARTNPHDIFLSMMRTMNSLPDTVEKASFLDNLGVKATRDIQLMTRLAGSVSLYEHNQRLAADAAAAQEFASQGMATILGTLAEKFNQMIAAMQNWAGQAGNGFLPMLGAVVDAVKELFTWLAKDPVGRFTSNLVLAATGLAALRLAFSSVSNAALAGLGALMRWRAGMDGLSRTQQFFSPFASNIGQLRNAAEAAGVTLRSVSAASTTAGNAINTFSSRALSAATQTNTATNAVSAYSKAALGSAAGMRAAGVAAGAMGANMAAGAIGVSTMGAAFRGLVGLLGGPIGIGITAATLAIPALVDAFTAGGRAAEQFKEQLNGALDGKLVSAMQQDTANFAKGVKDTYQDLNITVGGNTSGFKQLSEAQGIYINSSGQVVSATREVADAMGYSTLKVGENTRALIFQSIEQTDMYKKMSNSARQILRDSNFDWSSYAGNMASGNVKAAEAEIDSTIASLKSKIEGLHSQLQRGPNGEVNWAKDHNYQLHQLAQSYGEVIRLMEGMRGNQGIGSQLTQELLDSQIAAQAMAPAMDEAAASIDNVGQESTTASQALDTLVGNLFAGSNAAIASTQAWDTLSQSLYNNGTSMNTFTTEGAANMQAVQGYLTAVAQEAVLMAEQMGLSSQDASNYVRQYLLEAIQNVANQGVDMSAFANFPMDVANIFQAGVDLKTEAANIISEPISASGIDTAQFDSDANGMVNTAHSTAQQVNNYLSAVRAQLANFQSRARKQFPGKLSFVGDLIGMSDFYASGMQGSLARTHLAAPKQNRSNANQIGAAIAKGMQRYTPRQLTPPKVSTGGSGGGRGGSGGGSGSPRTADGSGGRGGSSPQVSEAAARQTQRTAAEIFKDFLSRLTQAMNDTLSSFWKSSDAMDGYMKHLNSMRKSLEQTRKKIKDLREENAKLRKDMYADYQKIDEARWFQSVAASYGDGKRVAALQAEINEYEKSINEKQKTIQENEREAKTLEAGILQLNGYTDAAIENREALRGLQERMVKMIEAYAESGASTQELEAYTRKLKAEFIAQATQLGYNRGEVNKLAGAFDNLGKTVREVPRYNPEWARQDAERAARAAQSYSSPSYSGGGGIGGGIGGFGGGGFDAGAVLGTGASDLSGLRSFVNSALDWAKNTFPDNKKPYGWGYVRTPTAKSSTPAGQKIKPIWETDPAVWKIPSTIKRPEVQIKPDEKQSGRAFTAWSVGIAKTPVSLLLRAKDALFPAKQAKDASKGFSLGLDTKSRNPDNPAAMAVKAAARAVLGLNTISSNPLNPYNMSYRSSQGKSIGLGTHSSNPINPTNMAFLKARGQSIGLGTHASNPINPLNMVFHRFRGASAAVGTHARNPHNPVDAVFRYARGSSAAIGTHARNAFQVFWDAQDYASNRSVSINVTARLGGFASSLAAVAAQWRRGYANGGLIGAFASGGLVPGRTPANRKKDNMLATNGAGLLSVQSGEYVISSAAVRHYGVGFMNAINQMNIPSLQFQQQLSRMATPQPQPQQQVMPDMMNINPAQIAQIVKAVQTVISLDGKAIGASIQGQNNAAAARGVY